MNTIFSKNDRITVADARDLVLAGHTVQMVLPLWMGLKNDSEWMFPIEPLISVSGKKEIIRRKVSKTKQRGTIKERWTEDDMKISVQGSFRHADLYTYPGQDVSDFKNLITQKTALYVKNELFQLLNIHQIVVESYSFPFSKGENVQNFTFEAYSDDLFELFIDVKDV